MKRKNVSLLTRLLESLIPGNCVLTKPGFVQSPPVEAMAGSPCESNFNLKIPFSFCSLRVEKAPKKIRIQFFKTGTTHICDTISSTKKCISVKF